MGKVFLMLSLLVAPLIISVDNLANNLEPDQDGPDLDLNCLHSISVPERIFLKS